MRILLKDLDAGSVHQKSVVQDEKVVIENAERVTLFATSMYRYKVCKIIERKRILFHSMCKTYLFYFVFLNYIAKSDIILKLNYYSE